MDPDYAAFESSLYTEFKDFCKKITAAYKDLKEELTPYKDDRYYRLAPMRLYTLSKRYFVLVFVVFFLCFGLTLFIGIAGPNVIEAKPYRSEASNSSKFGQYTLQSPVMSTYNQQLWLMCRIELDKIDESSFQNNFTMSVKIHGVSSDATVSYVDNKQHSRPRILSCAQKCEEIIVVHLGYLNYTQYNLDVRFENLNLLKYTLTAVTFTWKTYNPTFSQVEIWFRFVFVVLTFMVTCLFAHSLRKFSMRDWGIEQKWMSVLLPLLLLYNDPFFPLTFLVNSWFPGMLDDLFQSLFLCALLLFWLCVYHGIRVQGERKCMTFYLPKFLIVGLLWLASVTLGIWQTVNELHDPTYQYRVDTGNFQGMKIFFLIVATLYILYLMFLVIRACSELRNMPYVESQLKDNPAFSMLNDSDDDVIYGSRVSRPTTFGARSAGKIPRKQERRMWTYCMPWVKAAVRMEDRSDQMEELITHLVQSQQQQQLAQQETSKLLMLQQQQSQHPQPLIELLTEVVRGMAAAPTPMSANDFFVQKVVRRALQKMTLGDNIEAFLTVFKGSR
ncbi:transmembrane protein 181 isoform X3 [Phyllobates terribilis]|uniref:transmembrane protein 181 isoform X3 n=1 Tax=Phyllobates terribilis TaxID=111132 RepID=UPI003CCB2125